MSIQNDLKKMVTDPRAASCPYSKAIWLLCFLHLDDVYDLAMRFLGPEAAAGIVLLSGGVLIICITR